MYTHMRRFVFRMEECKCRLLGFLTWYTIYTWVTCYMEDNGKNRMFELTGDLIGVHDKG